MCSRLPAASLPSTCKGGCKNTCGKRNRLWVIAANEGMIGIFEKREDALISPLSLRDAQLLLSRVEFTKVVQQASDAQEFDQLIIVGSQNDISWLREALYDITNRVIAEIDHPLMPVLFQNNAMDSLKNALLPLVS